MTRDWIGVASRDHVEIGAKGGVAQLSHGKERPPRRMQPGGRLVYYLPRAGHTGGETVQAFVRIGPVLDDAVCQHRLSDTFVPVRRNMAYDLCQEAPIRPLSDHLAFITDTARWGYSLRAGHVEINQDDFRVIATEMGGDSAEAAGGTGG